MDLGKCLFTFTIDNQSKKEYLAMGRAIQYRNSKKWTIGGLIALLVLFILGMTYSVFVFIVFAIVAIELVVFMEYSARNIAGRLKDKAPFTYEFYEDGLIEKVDGKSNTILYPDLIQMNGNKTVFTLMTKDQVVVVPRSLLDRDSDLKLMKLQGMVGRHVTLRVNKKKTAQKKQ